MAGLRQEKKLQLRQAIADAALRLFVERGFDHVTVAEVARAAGVSEKTVFNYFPTKEDLFFDEAGAREQELLALIHDRAPGESILAALRRVNISQCRRALSDGFSEFARVIEETPALQAKERALFARFSARLAEAIRDELGRDQASASVAATALVGAHWSLFREARRRALAGERGPAAERRLRRDNERAFDLLEHGLGHLG
jgi:AcrR family transcriptional regulator